MQSARLLARAASRNTFKSARSSIRTFQSPALQRSWRPTASIAQTLKQTACFSSSTARYEVNEELFAKLDQELVYEKESPQDEGANDIKEYLSASEFQLEDVEGSQEVHLVRSFNDEQIKVTFSTAGLTSAEEAEADAAMYDEEGGIANQGGAQDGKVRQAPEDDLDGDEYGSQSPVIVAVDIQVSRPGKGAVLLETELDPSGQFYIKHVAYYPTAELAEGKTAEAQIAQRNLYTGPPFVELDENLQALFDEFLKERGINESMGVFIPNYIDQKETQEYVRWLENVKKFVE
ncbi:Mitochondrial glycoprotein-like protein [Elsinoe fawcettii]|nr:Mitochondrial glycoprotein-like protein [Elsinoe fawcettii]